jgi:hypothetical protein
MIEMPEWVATLVGRLTLENEMLRRVLAELEQQAPAQNGNQLLGGAMAEQFVMPETAQ